MFPSWAASDLSLTFTISMICFCLGGFLSGRLSSKLKRSLLVLIAAALLAAGFWGVSGLDSSRPQESLISLFVFYGGLCGFGVGIGYNAVISAIVRWFPDKAGLCSGLLLMSFGFGGMVLGSAVNQLIKSYGLLHTFVILAVVVLIVLPSCAFLIKVPDETKLAGSGASVVNQREYTPSKMVRSSVFWLFFLWNVLISSAGFLVINSAAVIASDFGAPAVLGLMVSVFNGIGRVTFGSLFDKIGRKKTLLITCALLMLSGVCLFIGAFVSNVVLVFAGMLLVGTSFGASPAISSAGVNQFFGSANYPVNYSIHNFLAIPAATIGPLVSGVLLEQSNGADNSTFLMIIIFAAAAFFFNALLNKAAARFI
jgi:OFA family oxalate/formate antiporter-like MFS transporter